MSGLKIGELFMDLGFEVDDKTLKSFNSTINETLSGILRLAGISASVAGFASIMTGASDTVLALRNMNKEFGYSTEGMQRWAAIVHQANPLVSHEQGLNSYRKMAEYIRNMQFGTGDAGFALGMFGGGVEDNTPEKIQDRIRKGLPNVIKNYGQGKASEWIDQITGGVAAINAFNLSLEDMQIAAEKGKRALKDDADLVEMRIQAAGLKEEWDVFMDHIAASFAPTLIKIMKDTEKGGLSGFIDSIGEWDPFNLTNIGKNAINAERPIAHAVSSFIEDHNMLGGNSEESLQFWMNKGYSRAQAAGFVAQEKRESGFNPHAVGDGGRAFGSFQMHPDRAKAIFDATGIDVRTADHYKQLQGAYWDFQHSGLAAQFERFKDSPEDAAEFLSKKWERPGDADGEASARAKDAGNIYHTSVTAPITIHSTAPAQDVAYHAVSELNKQLIDTSAQTDLGPSH